MIEASTITPILKTLADPTRRAVYERLSLKGAASVSELVSGSNVSQPAISQHLRALRDAGLVREERKGRRVFYRPEPQGLAPLVSWIGHYSRFWNERFDQLEKLLKELDQ